MRPLVVLSNDDANVQGGDEKDAFAARGVADDAAHVARALAPLGPVERIATKDGDPGPLAERLRELDPRCVFNLCEAARGVSALEASVAALLDLAGVAYTGNTPGTLALCLDKPRTKTLLQGAGIPVPRGVVVKDAARDSFRGVDYPAIVKPAFLDASHGIEPANVVATEEAARKKAAELLAKFGGAVLVERFVDGRELNVSIVALERGTPTVLALAEIDWQLPAGMPRVVGYEAKWVEGSESYRKTPVRCPIDASPALEARVREVALAAWEAAGCRDYARVDMRLDEDERPFVLEVNPNPCIAPDAGLARSASVSGWSYDDLIRRIARNAEERGPLAPIARRR